MQLAFMRDAKRLLRPGGICLLLAALGGLILGFMPLEALAHGVTAGDKGYIQEISGPQPLPFIYLGAKHMMTGYDHQITLSE